MFNYTAKTTGGVQYRSAAKNTVSAQPPFSGKG